MTTREFRVAPSEPDVIKRLGSYSILCESHGADIIWEGLNGLCGAQRKTTTDLIASVRDNRLGQEMQQLQRLRHRFLVIEGQASWNSQGELMNQHTRWHIHNQWGVELSCQLYGVMIVRTRSTLETVDACNYLYDWTQRSHDTSSLLTRGTEKNGWGRIDDRTTFVHTFSAVPTISTELAGRIFDTHGNILTLKVGADELMQVPGLGPKRVASILRTFGVTSNRDRSGDQS